MSPDIAKCPQSRWGFTPGWESLGQNKTEGSPIPILHPVSELLLWHFCYGAALAYCSKCTQALPPTHVFVCLVTQSCPTLCHPKDCSPSGSSVHEILQARILEGVAISSSRRSSWLRNWTHISYVSCIGRWFLYHYATWVSLMAQRVKNSPAMQEMQEMWVWSLAQEDPLEE